MTYVIVAAIFFGAGYYAGGHPDQVASRASLTLAWIKAQIATHTKGK